MLFLRALLLTVALTANASAPLIPGRFAPMVCADYFAALVRAHEDVVVFDGANRRGGFAVLDPWQEAEDQSMGIPVVTGLNPFSADSFRRAFNALLPAITAATAPAQVQAFAAHWGIAEEDVLRLLLPYRLYNAPAYPALVTLFPNQADSQRTAAWLKYEHYFREFPALRARYDFYVAHAGQETVPEMVRMLRTGGDAIIDEPRAYREINALHLQISHYIEEPLQPAERLALNLALGAAGQHALPANPISRAAAAVLASNDGVPNATVAAAIGLSEQQLSFYRHWTRQPPRLVPWDREVDHAGVRQTEDALLRTLHGLGMSHVEIADTLNAAFALRNARPVLPNDADFRTVAAVSGRLSTLQLTNGTARSTQPVTIPGYGITTRNSQLQLPQALQYLRDRLAVPETYAVIATRLGVSETALREFERKWSEEYGTGLPTVLSRFLLGPPGGAAPSYGPRPSGGGPNAAARAAVPAAGANPAFDRFAQDEVYLDGTRPLSMGSRNTEAALFTLMEKRLTDLRKMDAAETKRWQEAMAQWVVTSGRDARRSEPATASRRARFRVWSVLETYVALLQARDASSPHSPKSIQTKAGLLALSEQINGEAFVPPPRIPPSGEDKVFDRFVHDDVYLPGTEALVITTETGQTRTLDSIERNLSARRAFTPEEAEKLRIARARINPTSGGQTRIRTAGADNKVVVAGRNQRRRYFELLDLYRQLYGARVASSPHDATSLAEKDKLVALSKDLLTEPPELRTPEALRIERYIDDDVFLAGTEGMLSGGGTDDAYQFLNDVRTTLAIVRPLKLEEEKRLTALAAKIGASRLKLARSSTIGTLAETSLAGRRAFWEMEELLLELYQVRHSNSPHTIDSLATSQGLRDFHTAILGRPLGRYTIVPKLGEEPLFDAFATDKVFLGGTENLWVSKEGQPKTILQIRQHLEKLRPLDSKEIEKLDNAIASLGVATGATARRATPNGTTIPDTVRDHRRRVWNLDVVLLDLYRAREPKSPHTPETLATTTGLRAFHKTIVGDTAPEDVKPPVRGEDPTFDAFMKNDVLRILLRTSVALNPANMDAIEKALKAQKPLSEPERTKLAEARSRFGSTSWDSATRVLATAKPVIVSTIELNRRRYWEWLLVLLELHKVRTPDSRHTAQTISTSEGLRAFLDEYSPR